MSSFQRDIFVWLNKKQNKKTKQTKNMRGSETGEQFISLGLCSLERENIVHYISNNHNMHGQNQTLSLQQVRLLLQCDN